MTSVGTSVRDKHVAGQHGEHHRLGQRHEQVPRRAGEEEHRHEDDADAQRGHEGRQGDFLGSVQDGLAPVGLPGAMCRWMFSMATVASSTRMPTASASPPSVIRLIVSPRALRAMAMETSTDSGIETAMIVSGDPRVGRRTARRMAVDALQARPQMHVRAWREVGPAFFPTRLGMATQAGLVSVAHDVRLDRPVGIEQFLVVGDLDRLAFLNRPLDRGELGTGTRRPAEIPGAQLLLALVEVVPGHVAQQAVGLQHPGLGPAGLEVVAVEIVVALGGEAAFRIAHPAVVAFSLPVVFRGTAAGVACSAGRGEEGKGG